MQDTASTCELDCSRSSHGATLRNAVCAMVFAATPAVAEDWTALDGDGIRAVLSDRTVDYEGAWQRFDASGRTVYNAGSDSLGTWDTRADQYCSQWPPNADWSCYDVDISPDGARIRFSAPGDATIGSFR